MDSGTVKELAQPQEGLAVSILCPFNTRLPGNAHDSAVLKELRDSAVEKVDAALPGGAGTSLIARIDEAVAAVDMQHPREAVAVMVSPTVSRVITLDAPVEPNVVVGERFAIRDLLTAMSRSGWARIVLLSQEKSRCLDLRGGEIIERHDFGFPVEVVPPTEADTPHGDFPLDEHEHAEAAKFVFRAVNHALADLERHERWPLVLVGAQRDLAYFDEVSDPRAHIVGRVHGNHQRDTPDEIVHLVHAVLDEYEGQRQRSTCDEVREAIGSHAVSGIDDTWQAARAGRGHRLVVEVDYRFPARVVEGTLQVASNETDAVEATLEEVVRHDGDVVVVPAGSLADLGHIALFTRY